MSWKPFDDLDRVLADHRVDDEEDVLRLGLRLDVGELLHELLVDREAAGGVVDDDVAAELLRLGRGALRRSSTGDSPAMLKTGTSTLLPSTWSCSTAAGRCMSAATRSGLWFSFWR